MQGIRESADGVIFPVRNNPKIIRELDTYYERISPSLWMDKEIVKDFRNLKDKYPGTFYVIGKGPSASRVPKTKFEEGCPIFCCNEAIDIFDGLDLPNPVFGVQVNPKPISARIEAPYIVDYKIRGTYNAEIRVNSKLLQRPYAHAAQLALLMGQYMGGEKVCMIGFDASTRKDYGYAKEFGEVSGNPKRFGKQAHYMVEYLPPKVIWMS